ncbi:unnamed protein product [Moneuplotes crassus]|uniref:N-acetyltransferase domain-containing protein n=1 Tax=Euplotes crassus TaxID=5936 RepID=A0AAD1UCY3_EUPCR|nr:unnamed protein product [Moneuplotes crassus]
MEIDLNVQRACQCNANGYGNVTIQDLRDETLEYPSSVTIIRNTMHKASCENQNRYYDKSKANELFVNPLPEYLNTKKNTMFFKAYSNKCVGYISTVDFKIVMHILDDRRIYIDTTAILDFYIHEDCQRKGHGKQLMDYLLLVKGIEPRKVSLYKPSKAMFKFMKKHYGLSARLDESVEVYTFKDILGSPGDGENKYELYQEHLKFLEEKKKNPNILDIPMFSSAMKPPPKKDSTLKNSGRRILENSLTKSIVGIRKEEKKIDPLSYFAFSRAKNKKSNYIKESLDELMKPIIQDQMGHDADDISRYLPGAEKQPDPSEEFSQYYASFVPSDNAIYEPGQRVLRPIRSQLPKDLHKSLLPKKSFPFGVTAKEQSDEAQNLIKKKGLKTDVYCGKEVLAPLYQVELKEINAMNDRYNASRVEELTMRQEMDRLAQKNKLASMNRYNK